MSQQRWTREQLLRTLSLYCQLPFGKMHSRQPAVVALGAAIDRTASAVALKLVNFASLDPELRERGISGMGNSSAGDRAVWDEFYGRWEMLAQAAMTTEDEQDAAVVNEAPRAISPPLGPTEVRREQALRRGQAFFRAAVLAGHDGRCCITGIESEALLRASHIVPWSKEPGLRLDPRNGLCLNALHDAALDRGLISVSDSMELLVSGRLRDQVPPTVYAEMFESRAGKPIRAPERFRPSPEMLAYHRREVFVV